MAKDSNVTARQQSPRVNQTTRTIHLNATSGVNKGTSRVSNEMSSTDASRTKVEALAEIICAGGNEAAAALLVLMRTLEASTDPKLLAHTAKHFAFTRCGELNVYEMVDAQIEMLERELLAQV